MSLADLEGQKGQKRINPGRLVAPHVDPRRRWEAVTAQGLHSPGGLFTLCPGFSITQRQWRRGESRQPRTIRPSSCYPAVIVEAMRNNSKDDGCSTLRRDIISGKTIRSVPAGTKLPCLSPGFIGGSIIKALFLRLDRLWLVKNLNNGRT